MYTLLKSVPVPMSGLMLGVVSLAKLFFLLEADMPANILFVIGTLLFILLLLKAIFLLPDVLQELKNPVIASVAPTFTMGMLVIASIFRLHNVAHTLSTIVWIVAAILQLVLVIYFVIAFIYKSQWSIQSVLPSWFVLFVGIAMMPATAPQFAKPFTQIVFYVALTMLVILMPVVLSKIFILRDIPVPAKPLITILAAPTSLCTTAYIGQFEHIHSTVLAVLIIVAQLLYFIVLYEVQTLIKMPFFPSFGAFTFPLVVSAMALKMTSEHLVLHTEWMDIVIYFETIIATGITVYVLFMYMKFIILKTKNSIQQKLSDVSN